MDLPKRTDRPDADPKKAEKLFAEFRVRVQAGEEVSLEELCERHPDEAGALRILHSLDGSSEAPDTGMSGASLLRRRELEAPPQDGAGRFCIRCGAEIGDARTCPSPSCQDLPNFYRTVVRRSQPRRTEGEGETTLLGDVAESVSGQSRVSSRRSSTQRRTRRSS